MMKEDVTMREKELIVYKDFGEDGALLRDMVWQMCIRDRLSFALEVAQKTNGALEPTIYPVLAAWGFTTEERNIPSEQELSLIHILLRKPVSDVESAKRFVRQIAFR